MTAINAAINSVILHPELASYAQQIARIREDASELTRNLSAAQMNWRTHSGRWSIAQCLQHISLGNEEYLRAINAGLAQARARQLLSAGPYKHGWFGNWFARSFEPPPKFRMKNPRVITPRPDLRSEEVIARFHASFAEVLRRIHEANGLDLGRAKIISPFFRLLRLSLGQAFAVLTAHARRHLWQAWQVRKEPAFPKP
jgi:hypothetical protein